MIWGIVRGFFYVWFSLVIGLAAAYGTFAALSTQGPTYRLPGGGWPLGVFWIALILASLISTQASHFGKRVRLLKWIPLCVVATLALLFSAATST